MNLNFSNTFYISYFCVFQKKLSYKQNKLFNFKFNFSLDFPQNNKIKPDDILYIQETVGTAIRKGLAAVVLHQPADPIKFFANFLLHYRFTQSFFQQREAELNYFLELRKQIKSEKCQKN